MPLCKHLKPYRLLLVLAILQAVRIKEFKTEKNKLKEAVVITVAEREVLTRIKPP